MGTTGALREETKERRQVIIELLSETDKTVKATELADALGMKNVSFRSFMTRLMRADSRIRSVKRGRNTEYFLEEQPVEEEKKETLPTVEERKYEDSHNGEGYPDPTYAAALRNTGNLGVCIEEGEIWYLKNDEKNVDQKVLILAKFNTTVTCVLLYDNAGTLPEYDAVQCKTLTVDGKMLCVNVVRILTKGLRSLFSKAGKVDLFTLRKIKAYIGEYLGMQKVGVVEVEKPVTVYKTVEKKVVAPAATSEKLYSKEEFDKAVELAVLKEQNRLYQEMFKTIAEALARR